MVQHVLIGDLAPLCLLAGLNGPMLRPLLAFRPVERLRVLANPPRGGVAALGGQLYVWHLPFLYEAAVRHSAVHALEHVCFFAAGLVVWLPVLETLLRTGMVRDGSEARLHRRRLRGRDGARERLLRSGDRLLSHLRERRGASWGISPSRIRARRRGDDDRGLAGHDRRSLLALPPAGPRASCGRSCSSAASTRAPSAVPCATAARRSLPAALNSEGHDALQRDPPRRSRRLVRRAEPALLP